MKRHIVKKVKRYKSHRFYLPEVAKKKINEAKKNNIAINGDNIKTTENNKTDKEINKEEINMDTNEKIERMQDILQEPQTVEKVKRVKRDKSLIERAENTKIVMVDDNKMLLKD